MIEKSAFAIKFCLNSSIKRLNQIRDTSIFSQKDDVLVAFRNIGGSTSQSGKVSHSNVLSP